MSGRSTRLCLRAGLSMNRPSHGSSWTSAHLEEGLKKVQLSSAESSKAQNVKKIPYEVISYLQWVRAVGGDAKQEVLGLLNMTF